MLNELWLLQRSLASRGVKAERWHQWIKPFKKADAIVAEIGALGKIERVTSLSAEQVAKLRNIAPDFHNSFPGMNLQCPIFEIDEAADHESGDDLWQRCVVLLAALKIAYAKSDLQRLKRVLFEFPVSEVGPRLSSEEVRLKSTRALISRIAESNFEAEGFLRELGEKLLTGVQSGAVSKEVAIEVFFGKWNKKKKTREPWKATLMLDVSDQEEFFCRVLDPSVGTAWSDALFEGEDGESPKATCALTGRMDEALDEGKMPCPTLVLLGPTVLMAMNDQIPCQTRYRRTGSGVYRIGKTSVQEISDALLLITAPERRGKTWEKLPNAARDKPDLLIAYLEDEPDADVPLPSIFTDLESDPEWELGTYETRTKRVFEMLQQTERNTGDLYLSVFALSEVDKGRKQVLFGGRYSVSAVMIGCARWAEGCRNAPIVSMAIPQGKGRPARRFSGYQPSPAEVMRSFKKQWIRQGSEGKEVPSIPGVDIGRVYSLLLDADPSPEASWLLERYLPATGPLISGLGRHMQGVEELPAFVRRDALIAVSVYGLLLYLQGRRKETYMESRDYLVGRFLQLGDLLHRLYCKHERGGSLPPQLIGNAALSMAIQSPRRAISSLGQRMAVYLAWAERYEGEEAGLAKWCRSELARVSSRLKDENLDSRVTVNGKAEMFLGYLGKASEKESVAE